jgi:beta-glucosidase
VVGCGDKIMKPSLYTKDNLLERKVDSVLKLMTLEKRDNLINIMDLGNNGPTPKRGTGGKKV